jgi:hypothetical protein
MAKDSITVIWFTGVISQYDIEKYDLENLKINHNILNKIINDYKADKYIAIIWVGNEEEKDAYTRLITKEHLENKLLFVFLEDYNNSYTPAGMVASLSYYYHIVNYIDCSRTRLCKVRGFNINNLIHISQLLD